MSEEGLRRLLEDKKREQFEQIQKEVDKNSHIWIFDKPKKKDYNVKINKNGDLEISFITTITLPMKDKWDRYMEEIDAHIEIGT